MIKKVINNDIKKISSIKQIINSELKNIKRIYKGNKLMFSNILPKEYQEVEYIESTGTQYIDTGINEKNIKYEIDFEKIGNNGHIFSRWRMGYSFYNILALSYDELVYGIYNGSFMYSNLSNFSRITVTASTFNGNNSITVKEGNDIVYENNWNTFAYHVYLNYYLFAENDYNTTSNYFIGRIYSFKMYNSNNNVLMQHLIPCYRKADCVAGMYDLVSGEFFTNQGTGEFIIGGEI